MTTTKRESVKKRSLGIAARDNSMVSKRLGFPASSIYWHFKDKDDLISTVIERSFNDWLQAVIEFEPLDSAASTEEFVVHQSRQVTMALEVAPDFLRLGLMLGLEQRPEDPTALTMFLNVRSQAFGNSVKTLRKRLPEVESKALEQLASFIIALADG